MPINDPSISDFVNKLLKEIRFFPVKREIEQEYRAHIEDKIQDLVKEEEMTKEEALSLTLKEMGDPQEIGKTLNNVHNPFLGWALSISWGLLIIFGAFTLHLLIYSSTEFFFYGTNETGIEEQRVIKEVVIDQEVQIDEVSHYFDRMVIQDNGTAFVLIESESVRRQPRNRPIWFTAVYDDLGNTYSEHSLPYRSRFFRSDFVLKLRNFSEDAQALTLVYNRYNREFEVTFPLPERSERP